MLKPTSEVDLAEAVASTKGPLKIQGGGTRPLGMPVDGEVLSTAGLTGITLYEPGALTIVAKAGTPLAEVEAALAAEGQMLPFEPMDHRALLGTTGEPTIGGVVATNASGPRRIQAGACRDSLIGVRFVDGSGQMIKNGGRVMKNVTGYDLVKLMAGSYGTLGVITEVSFKVLPKPEATATLVYADNAAERFAGALTSPFDVSGAGQATDVMLRLEGFEASVAGRAKSLESLLGKPDRVDSDPTLWDALRNVTPLADSTGDIWRISVKPSDHGILDDLAKAQVLDWGGGLIWACIPEGTDLRAKLREDFNGHATLIRASDQTKNKLGVFHPEPAPLAAIADGLRAKFDPRGILNPGRMG